MARNRVIGKENSLPWRLPDEIDYFRRVTSSHATLMGRKTFESMNCRPLPNRFNIVLTSRSFDVTDVVFVDSLAAGFSSASNQGFEKCFVIGGSKVYEEALTVADTLYCTVIDAELEGDVLFPQFDWADWVCESTRLHPTDTKHEYAFSMNVYRRRE